MRFESSMTFHRKCAQVICRKVVSLPNTALISISFTTKDLQRKKSSASYPDLKVLLHSSYVNIILCSPGLPAGNF